MIYMNEMYPAVQGEGPHIGTPCVFIRTHGCPVGCKWCDTPFTWDGSESGTKDSVDQIVERANDLIGPKGHVVITGGEPLIQPDLKELLFKLAASGRTVEIETSGIKAPPEVPGIHWNVSPKAPSAAPKIEPDPEILSHYLAHDSVLKIVVGDDVDLQWAEHLIAAIPWPDYRVWLMPEGATRERLQVSLKWLLNKVVDKKLPYRVTDRMHVVAFDDKRGV